MEIYDFFYKQNQHITFARRMDGWSDIQKKNGWTDKIKSVFVSPLHITNNV